MTVYVLVPGADGAAWYWHLLAPELRARGHEVAAVDLPTRDSADLDTFADVIAAAARTATGGHDVPVTLVAQSLGGFSAPLVCARVPVGRLVLVNAMVPAPGETGTEWWDATGQPAARREYAAAQGRDPDAPFDVRADFFHDVPPEVTEEAFASAPQGGPPAAVFAQPWPLDAWPAVPTRFLQGREDRFFPLEFQRRVVRERLGPAVAVEELSGGHLLALSRPRELAAALLGRPASPARAK